VFFIVVLVYEHLVDLVVQLAKKTKVRINEQAAHNGARTILK